MKSISIIALTSLVGVFAAPAVELVERQLGFDTSNDFIQGGCKGVIMIYARASTETGNIGLSCGPILKTGLNRRYRNDFAMQGVKYPADLVSNFLPDGTLQSAINTMADLIQRAANECPNAKIAAGGYSQGTAVTAGAISKLPTAVRDRVGAVVLFGYTKNLQNKGGIPGYQQDRLKVYCALGDLVCTGTLIITASHFTYMLSDADKAVDFVYNKLGPI